MKQKIEGGKREKCEMKMCHEWATHGIYCSMHQVPTPIQETEKCHFCGKPAPNFPGGCVTMCDECLKEPIQETWQEELREIIKQECADLGIVIVNWGKEDTTKPLTFLEDKLTKLINSLLQRKEREVSKEYFNYGWEARSHTLSKDEAIEMTDKIIKDLLSKLTIKEEK